MSKKPLVIGHRGAAGLEPENTLRSFRRALEIGVDLVELDVWLVDGEVIVFHDRELERLTNGTGLLVAQRLDALQNLKVRNSERIPLLTEVLDLIDQRCGVNIELKGPGVAEAVVQIAKRYVSERGWNNQNFLISSFDHTQLLRIAELQPALPLGVLLYGIPADLAACAEKLGAYSLHIALDFLNPELIRDAHARELICFVYTVNSKADYDRVVAMGADGFFTDYPDRFIDLKPGRS